MMDSSPFRWLEDRGPACHLIALIDDATSRIWARFVEHDTTEESLRTLRGWLERPHRLEQILSVRVARTVAADHTVKWDGQRWGRPAGGSVCRAARGTRRNRTAARWLALAAPPRPLSAAAALPRRSDRGKASRPCRPKTQSPNQGRD